MMNTNILVVGATGLIGSTFLNKIRDDESFEKIIVLTRREINSIKYFAQIDQYIVDFINLEKYKHLIAAQTVVCALGTTIKKAGSKENFSRVDYHLPIRVAGYALENGTANFIVVSAIGADPDSKVFYNRVKGEMERDMQNLSFRSIHILKPSLLLGNRTEFRLGEEIGKIIIQPIRYFIPAKYHPIHAEVIARKIQSIAKNPLPGIHFYEGKQLHKVDDFK